MDRFLSILKELQHDRKVMIERLARFQSEADAAGFDELATMFGGMSSSAALTFEKLDGVLADFQMERNRVSNES